MLIFVISKFTGLTRAHMSCVCALQTASTNVAYSDMLSQQNQALQSAQTSLPALPPQLAGTLNGIISGLSSGVSQAATVGVPCRSARQ